MLSLCTQGITPALWYGAGALVLRRGGGGHSTFFGGCVPHRFPKVGSRELIFLEK